MLHRTSLAHAERSAYNSRWPPSASISWDRSLTRWTLSGDLRSARWFGRLRGHVRVRPGVAREGGPPTVGVHAGLAGVRRRVPPPDHDEVDERGHEEHDRHPLAPAQAEHVVELDRVDPEVLDPEPAQAVRHHVD